MLDIQGFVAQLKRPKLLVRAARFGMDDYRRDRDLRRALKSERLPGPGEALMTLSEIEAEMNDRRVKKNATYSLALHIDVLVAIMCEAQIYQATRKQAAT